MTDHIQALTCSGERYAGDILWIDAAFFYGSANGVRIYLPQLVQIFFGVARLWRERDGRNTGQEICFPFSSKIAALENVPPLSIPNKYFMFSPFPISHIFFIHKEITAGCFLDLYLLFVPKGVPADAFLNRILFQLFSLYKNHKCAKGCCQAF